MPKASDGEAGATASTDTQGRNEVSVLLRLLQLASPSLPVGGYSYSEGLERAVEKGAVRDAATLAAWLADALRYGGARVETAVLVRVHAARLAGDAEAVRGWNAWLTATRESEELRAQSHDMGSALLRLLGDLAPPLADARALRARPCNFAVAFAVAAAHWCVSPDDAAIAYLHSWAANLVGAGVKLIPLGQTAGQQLLWDLQGPIEEARRAAAGQPDATLAVGNWGHALAAMQHEAQYSRLFRS